MPVVMAGTVLVVLIAGLSIALVYAFGLILSRVLKTRRLRRWLRRRLIHSYTCRRIARWFGSALLD